MKRFCIAICCMLFCTEVMAQQAPQTVPMDPDVIHGKLSNGMTYYIRHNEEPKDRASFYIIQNVGALLETDEQNGLAHFLEHMAFNGTAHFPEKGIINTLEKHGVAFGREINAYTAFNETVYNLSNVPVDQNGLVDTCLLILNDWSDHLLLTDEEIDAERGVITEEWRTRRTASFRMQSKFLPVLLKDSQYAVRDVIGDLDIIKNFEYDTVREFYRNWYRTDLQAIAIVGDFDAAAMEQKVISLLGKIEPLENPKTRPFFEIPSHMEPLYCLATDKEASFNSISLYIKHKAIDASQKNTLYLREKYMRSLFNAMTSTRISELLQKGDPPFINGSIGYSGFMRGYDVFALSATANPNQEATALKAIYTEAERVRRHGFTPGELERAKTNMLTNWDIQYKQRDKINHDRYVTKMQGHFLTQEPMASMDYTDKMIKAVLPDITLDEVSHKARLWMAEKDRVLIITGTDDPNTQHLSQDEAFAIWSDLRSAKIEPYNDKISGEALVDGTLMGSRIVSEKQLPEFDAVEWTLANDVKVIFRHADFEKDSVALRAFSMGGESLVDDARVPDATMLSAFVSTYGAGNFDNVALKKLLTGKKASCQVSLGNLTEGFSGSSTPKDFETMLQLLYLKFAQPRFDQEAHDAYMARYKSYVVTLKNNPQKIMSDHLSRIMTDNHPRVHVLDEALLEAVDFEQIEEIYRDRFSDAEDFCFVIVGNLDADTVKPLVETYIGSLVSTDRTETFVDHKINVPEGKTVEQIEIPLTVPKSNVNVTITHEMDYTPFNRLCLNVIEGILDIRYVKTIREEEGGTYGVSVSVGLSKYPVPEAQASFRFDCDPNKADHLKTVLYQELDSMVKDGPSQENLDKAVSNILKNREEAKQHNGYWLSTIYSYYFTGINSNDPANYEDILKQLTIDEIKSVAGALFTGGDVVDVIFKPKPK